MSESNGDGMKFPSVEQLRHVLKDMEYKGIHEREFRGTVKVHGTNARIEFLPDGTYKVGGRNQHNLKDGYMGWAEFAHSIAHKLMHPGHHYTIYGEWAGNGIQGGIPYPKQWFIFAVYDHKDELWYTDDYILGWSLPERVHLISSFGYKYFSLGPETSPETMEYIMENIQELVDRVDEECPVAKAMGYPGVHGEGWVFVPTDTCYPGDGFKVKGERHQTTKVQKEQTTVEGVDEFVTATLTEPRLMQGLENVELNKVNTGAFVKWVQQDIEKEDADLISEEGLRIALKKIGNLAAKWFLGKLDGH